MSQQPEAIRLAAICDQVFPLETDVVLFGTELRRLHDLKVRHIDLIDGLVAQRDTLRAQVERLQAAVQVSAYRCADCKTVLRPGYDCGACGSFAAEEMPDTPQPSPAPVAVDEREAFEVEMLKQGYGDVPRICSAGSPCEGEYANQYWELSWRIWQARAAQLPAERATSTPMTPYFKEQHNA